MLLQRAKVIVIVFLFRVGIKDKTFFIKHFIFFLPIRLIMILKLKKSKFYYTVLSLTRTLKIYNYRDIFFYIFFNFLLLSRTRFAFKHQ